MKKLLIFLSTQQSPATINIEWKNKSDTNLFYNSTKGGVDTVNQIIRKHYKKPTNLLVGMSISSTLIDVAMLNAYTLY